MWAPIGTAHPAPESTILPSPEHKKKSRSKEEEVSLQESWGNRDESYLNRQKIDPPKKRRFSIEFSAGGSGCRRKKHGCKLKGGKSHAVHARRVADGQTRHRCETSFLSASAAWALVATVATDSGDRLAQRRRKSRSREAGVVLLESPTNYEKRGPASERHVTRSARSALRADRRKTHLGPNKKYRSHDRASRTDLAESLRERKKMDQHRSGTSHAVHVRHAADITTTCTSFPARVLGTGAHWAKWESF